MKGLIHHSNKSLHFTNEESETLEVQLASGRTRNQTQISHIYSIHCNSLLFKYLDYYVPNKEK